MGVGAAVAGGAAVGAGATAGAEKLVGGSPEKAATPKEDIWRDVVDAIEKVKTGNQGPMGDVPTEAVIIEKAYAEGAATD